MIDADAVAVVQRCIPNFRPVGDTVITPGRLYRSSAMTGLDQEGWKAVAALGIRTLIDLRGPDEVASMPTAPPPGIELLSIPFQAQTAGLASQDFPADDAMASIHMAQGYRRIVASQGETIARVFLALVERTSAPTIIFCTAGKDRTGIVAALLLQAIGATHEEIHRDYAETNTVMTDAGRARVLELFARVSPFPMPAGPVRDVMLRADPAYIDAALDEAAPINGFLARHRIGSAEVAKLRKMLRHLRCAALP